MSNECHVGASLRQWYGPFFPATLPDLQTAYSDWVTRLGGLNSCRLAHVGSPLLAYQRPAIVQTSDGYKWARGPVYKIHRGVLIAGLGRILFPHCTDERRTNGTITDRSIAVYASSSEVTMEELAEMVRSYRVAFQQAVGMNSA